MTTTTATTPRVTKVKLFFEADYASDVSDFRTAFHWERFGQEFETRAVQDRRELDQDRRREERFDFDDERDPIYVQPRGAKLVIDKSVRYSNDDANKYSIAERLRWLKEDAEMVRLWKEDRWKYIGIVVEATVETIVDGQRFKRVESESLFGIEDGLGGLPSYSDSKEGYQAEEKYHKETVAEVVGELKTRLIGAGIEWPDDLDVPDGEYGSYEYRA